MRIDFLGVDMVVVVVMVVVMAMAMVVLVSKVMMCLATDDGVAAGVGNGFAEELEMINEETQRFCTHEMSTGETASGINDVIPLRRSARPGNNKMPFCTPRLGGQPGSVGGAVEMRGKHATSGAS